MDFALWIVAGLLAAVFALAGLMKLAQPRERLAASGLAWAGDFPAGAVKAIGGLEVAGALGLLLPATTGVLPILTPLAAGGLVLVMLGAAVTHARRGELPAIAVNAVLLVLAAVVAWGRFGPYAF